MSHTTPLLILHLQPFCREPAVYLVCVASVTSRSTKPKVLLAQRTDSQQTRKRKTPVKFSRFYRSAAIASVAALALAACSSDDSADENAGGDSDEQTSAEVSGTLIGGGASSQEAAMTAWTAGITETHPDLTVQYDPVGSGSGREGFIAGQYTFAGSDSAMDAEEQEQACGSGNAFHVP